MPGVALYTLLVVLAQLPQIHLAPDQPAPIFFTDEPLVAQFESPDSITASAAIYITFPNGETATWSATGLSLVGGRPLWQTVEPLSIARGPHGFRVESESSGRNAVFHQSLLRMDRPRPGATGLVGVDLYSASDALLYALRCLPVSSVRIDANHPDVVELAREVKTNTPGRLYIRLTPESARRDRTLVELARQLADVVDLWEVANVNGAAEYSVIAEDVRSGDPAARLAAQVSGAREAVALLRLRADLRPQAFVASPDAADAVEDATRRVGEESAALILDFAQGDRGDFGPQGVVPRVLESTMMPHREAIVPQRLLETPVGFSGALSTIAAASHLFEGTTRLAALDVDGRNRAWLFGRSGDTQPAEWVVAMTYLDESEPAPVVPADGVLSWTMFDAYGNVRAESGEAGTHVGTPPGFGLWFLRGVGGQVLMDAHVQKLRAHAGAALLHEAALTTVAPDAINALRLLRNYTHPAPTRLQFFNVVRSLPDIEEAWHRGVIEPRDATPLLYHLSSIARALAVIEQEADEPFLEPLERTFSNCGELIKMFSVASDEADARRVAYLRDEVRRLMDEARACEAAGRITEAKGVAALAEWRARSLEPAATIPVLEMEEDEAPADGTESVAPADDESEEQP